MSIKKSEMFAEGHFASIKIVSEYLQARWENPIKLVIATPDVGYRIECIRSLYLRALA
jgi:hypothetical protein